MIKDVMVRLDGTPGDDVRLAAVNLIAETFESHITGLFFNVMPSLIPNGLDSAGTPQATKLLDTAKQAGDVIESVNRQAVKTVEDLRGAIQKTADKPVLLLINRQGSTIFVTVKPANG